jgi:NADH dehydrogenase/NADH:ubiquinone oxidoreductase subunit G
MNKKGIFASIGIPIVVLLSVVLFVGFVGQIADSKIAKNKYLQDNPVSSDSEQYQEGINFIKQENWKEATIALVLLKEEGYKDSEALYNYASSQEQLNNDYRDIDMAVYYANNIPDDYAGVLKDDILKFKKEVIQENSNTTEEDKKQRKIEYAREQGLFDLEAVSFRWYISHSYVIAEGQVKNLTTSSLDNVMAVITYRTKDDTFITSDSALIEYTPLLAGQTSPFKVITPYNPEMSTASLEFAEFSGGKLNADYTYNK